MNRLFLSAAALGLSLTVTGAFAADMRAPVTKAPAAVAPAPVFDWSGFYAGGHAGWVWFKDDFDIGGVDFSDTLKGDGFVGGILAGYNWQLASQWVVGIEGDGGWASAESSRQFGFGGPGDLKAEMEHDAHLRLRLGYAAGRTLWFIAGGAAWAEFAQPTIFFGSPKETLTGWTIGAGVEHAYTDNLVLRLEYLYSDYGRERFDYTPAGGGVIEGEFRTRTVRAAAVWRFATGGKAPVAPAVVTKY